MKKIRSYLVAFALVTALIGSIILGMGSGSLANSASSQHINVAPVSGKSTQFVNYGRLGWCPIPGIAC